MKAEPNERCLDCGGLERAAVARPRRYSFILWGTGKPLKVLKQEREVV